VVGPRLHGREAARRRSSQFTVASGGRDWSGVLLAPWEMSTSMAGNSSAGMIYLATMTCSWALASSYAPVYRTAKVSRRQGGRKRPTGRRRDPGAPRQQREAPRDPAGQGRRGAQARPLLRAEGRVQEERPGAEQPALRRLGEITASIFARNHERSPGGYATRDSVIPPGVLRLRAWPDRWSSPDPTWPLEASGRRGPTRRATRFSTGPTAMPGAWRSRPPAQPPGVAKRRNGRPTGKNGMTDLETCKKMLDDLTTIETMDVQTEASHVAQWCRASLGEKDLASLRQDLAEELTRRRPMIVPTSEMQNHHRRLAVLEAAIDVLSDKRRDA
jgi:hypothetical protein